MKPRAFGSATAFYEAAGETLLRQEAQNGLMLGVVLRLVGGHRYGVESPFFFGVEDRGDFVAMATRTPPYNLLVWVDGDCFDALALVADSLHRAGAALPGVHGRAEVAVRFAEIWSARVGVDAKMEMEQRLYTLKSVRRPKGVEGRARWPGSADAGVLNEWARAFVAEAIPGDPSVDVRSMVECMIEAQQLLVWENGGPVSMAAATRPTPNGCFISFVYTPPAQRSRGYASACVAELSQRLLDSGKSFCALFADLANPTSNAIYQRIGYQPGGDFREIRFVAR